MSEPVALSILVPSFNPGRYLREAIASIRDQLIPGDEVIVQDGLSTDGSIEELREMVADLPQFSIYSERDNGQSDALQKALDKATRDYIMWLNADDIIYPGALQAVRDGLASNPDLLCGRSTVFNNDGRIVRTYTPGPVTRRAMLFHGSDLFTGSFAYRANLVREVGGFDAKYEYCMDVDLFARLTETEPVVKHIPDVIGGLRWHSESKGGSTLWPIVREGTQVKLEHARNSAERIRVLGWSGKYLLAGAALPIRHSRAYSAARAAVRERLK